MGEFAKYNGTEIKIGTCENMYYLRADQARLVDWIPGNVDPIKNAHHIRFRFPFPDEDNVRPGEFVSHDKAGVLSNFTIPVDVDHNAIQFRADVGYLVSLPCPESRAGQEFGYKIHRNGFAGNVLIRQQKFVNGQLVLVCACGGCGEPWRVPTLDAARPYINACIGNASRFDIDSRQRYFWEKIATRIENGYQYRDGL